MWNDDREEKGPEMAKGVLSGLGDPCRLIFWSEKLALYMCIALSENTAWYHCRLGDNTIFLMLTGASIDPGYRIEGW